MKEGGEMLGERSENVRRKTIDTLQARSFGEFMDNTNLSDKSFTYELPLNILSQPNENTARQALWSIADRLDLGHSILNFSLLSKLFSLILCHTNKASTSQVLRICLCLD